MMQQKFGLHLYKHLVKLWIIKGLVGRANDLAKAITKYEKGQITQQTLTDYYYELTK